MKYVDTEYIKAINSLTWTINSFTSIQTGFCCQMSYKKAFGFQSLLEFRIEANELWLCISTFLTIYLGNNHTSALDHPTADVVQMRDACALPQKLSKP